MSISISVSEGNTVSVAGSVVAVNAVVNATVVDFT
jgi:hypothetical protein